MKPEKINVEVDTYALLIHEKGQDLWQYRKKSPIQDNLEWIKLESYGHGEVPPLNLENTIVEQKTNENNLLAVIIYADKIEAVKNQKEKTVSGPQKGYIVLLSDGKRIPGENFNTTQQENMKEMVDYLIKEYNLTEKIGIPYYPTNSYKNCLINNEPKHPDGRDMRGDYELSDGNYLYTSLNNDQKKKYMKQLAWECNLEVNFKGEW
ncbi:MAG: hypothetical protein ACOCTT_01645 [archaeon]